MSDNIIFVPSSPEDIVDMLEKRLVILEALPPCKETEVQIYQIKKFIDMVKECNQAMDLTDKLINMLLSLLS